MGVNRMNRQSNQQSALWSVCVGWRRTHEQHYGNFEKPKDVKGALKRLVKYLGSNVYLMLILILVMMISTVINLLGPVIKAVQSMRLTLLKKPNCSVIFSCLELFTESELLFPFPAV